MHNYTHHHQTTTMMVRRGVMIPMMEKWRSERR